MYPVSDLYKTAVQENARSFTWSGNITTATGKNYSFVNKDIVNFLITLQFCLATIISTSGMLLTYIDFS